MLISWRSFGDFALFIAQEFVRFQGLCGLDLHAAADGRHQRAAFPNGIDDRFHRFGNFIGFNWERAFVTEKLHFPAGLGAIFLLLDVGRGNGNVDEVSQIGVKWHPVGKLWITFGETHLEDFAGFINIAN